MDKIYYCVFEETKYQKGQKMMRNVIQIYNLCFSLDILEKDTHILFYLMYAACHTNQISSLAYHFLDIEYYWRK